MLAKAIKRVAPVQASISVQRALLQQLVNSDDGRNCLLPQKSESGDEVICVDRVIYVELAGSLSERRLTSIFMALMQYLLSKTA